MDYMSLSQNLLDKLTKYNLIQQVTELMQKYENGEISKQEITTQIQELIQNKKNLEKLKMEKLKPKKLASQVKLKNGKILTCDLVASNADYAHTYTKLISSQFRIFNKDWIVKNMTYSMSLVVIYFAFKKDKDLDLRHHNIILGPRYQELLREIFDYKILGKDFSQYLHVPTLTDPSLAPEGYHLAYTLIPVPNNLSNLNWKNLGPTFVDKILNFLEERNYIPNLHQNLIYKEFITPDYFATHLNSYLGNAFGLEANLKQSAYFRPHNQSSDIDNLFLVGASTQPGAGTPAVMMSAKMTAKLISQKNN